VLLGWVSFVAVTNKKWKMEQPEFEKIVDMGASSTHYPTSIPLTRIKLVDASNYLVWAK
jgi:hypothetical protein